LEDDIKNESPRTELKWLTNRVPGRDFATNVESRNFGAQFCTVLKPEHFEKGYHGRMEISWTDRVRNEVLHGVQEKRNILHTQCGPKVLGPIFLKIEDT
jgi:hypothetical protein